MFQSEPSANLGKADMTPLDNHNLEKGDEKEITRSLKTETLKYESTYAHTTEKTTALPKFPPSDPNPQMSHDSDTCPHPPHPPETTVPKSLDAEVKAFTPTHSSVWAMIIWLGLGSIERRAAKDSPEVKAEGKQSAAPPTCASKDRTEPNSTPQETAICL